MDFVKETGIGILELSKKRRSIRRYKSDPVPTNVLNYIMEAARFAPSWQNKQCWKYILVIDPALKKQITERSTPQPPPTDGRPARPRDWMSNAPVIIVGCADPKMSGSKDGKEYYMLDMGISMEHIMLAAAEQGLGTCWVGGGFDEPIVKAALGIPEGIRVVALTPLGYADEMTAPRTRKMSSELLSKDRWQ